MQIKCLALKLLQTFHAPARRRSMALFTQTLNPITGQNAWSTQEDDYDYHQEVACAGFGDMLHDKERNQKYYAALRKTIEQMHAEGREAHVLDIGTGTGILSMMAVEAGADSVTACEVFLPMAKCAQRILEANGMSDKIQLIHKRSTELVVGKDLPRRANLLVTELLDTELIGEGAIGIYNHAHDELLTEDVICIPAKASCYAQVVQSPLAAQWNTMKLLANLDGDILLKSPQTVVECTGDAGLHDLQLSQLPLQQFHALSQPMEIFEFDFTCKQPREAERKRNILIKATAAGSTDLVFYWWDIQMDAAGEIVLSCAPFWAHPQFKHAELPWRDHWMQAIYHIPKPLHVGSAGEEFVLNCHHDEYSLWFNAFPAAESARDADTPRHACSCNFHVSYARTRIGQMNQSLRNKRFLRYLEETIDKNSHVLTIGDGCLLGLATAPLGATSVLCHESSRFSRRFTESVVQHNKLTNVQFVEKLEELEASTLGKLTHIFAEPYFVSSILPWDNFYFGTLLMKICDRLNPSVEVSPYSARIMAVPVEFRDLHKIRTPIGECEGFDLKLFDEMLDKASSLAQAKVEAQPLWEYPCRALAQPQEMLSVVFTNFDEEKETSGAMTIECSGSCNGIALWVDWQLDNSNSPKSTVSTGPTEPIEPGDLVKWDMFVRQGVHLIGRAQHVQQHKSSLQWALTFKPHSGDLKFNFEVKP